MIENAFTHVVWDSSKAIPSKLKTPMSRNRVTFTSEPRSIGTLRRASASFCGACFASCADFQCFLSRAASRKALHCTILVIPSFRGFSFLAAQRKHCTYLKQVLAVCPSLPHLQQFLLLSGRRQSTAIWRKQR